jgi:hypothetical protein
MFPLDLEIEVYDMTLSPDASKNTIPVKTGLSIIPLPEKQGKKTFRFLKSIVTKAEYDALPTEGTNKVIKTSWLTNMANNGSTVYVYNKYFEIGSDNFINAKAFADLAINPNPIREGTNRTASITFTMDASDADFASRNLTITLNGLADSQGRTTFTYSPSTRVVTINNLVTTEVTGEVSFTVEEENYAPATATASRRRSYFSNMEYTEGSLGVTAGEPVTFEFTLSDYEPGMKVNVELDGLEPSDGDLTSAATRATVTNWIFEPTSSNCSFDLKTIIAAENTCRVRLSADGYETSEWVEIEQRDKITIPAGHLRTSTDISKVKTIEIFAANPGTGTSVDPIGYFGSVSSDGKGKDKVYYNTYAIELDSIDQGTTIYFRYRDGWSYKTASVKLSDAISNEVTLTFK